MQDPISFKVSLPTLQMSRFPLKINAECNAFDSSLEKVLLKKLSMQWWITIGFYAKYVLWVEIYSERLFIFQIQ